MEFDQKEKQEEEEKEPGKKERSVLKMEDRDQFQCLACPEQVTLFSFFADLENHFLCIHKVSDLLTGPATSAVLLPTTLEMFTCGLCSGGRWLEEQEVREHLGTRHGDFFRDGQRFFVVSCR